MTEQEIVKVLAEREGWRWYRLPSGRRCMFLPCVVESWDDKYHFPLADMTEKPVSDTYQQKEGKVPNYLHSRDALAPVLEKMTEREQVGLIRLMRDDYYTTNSTSFLGLDGLMYALTIPPAKLARLMAEAIVECKGKETKA